MSSGPFGTMHCIVVDAFGRNQESGSLKLRCKELFLFVCAVSKFLVQLIARPAQARLNLGKFTHSPPDRNRESLH